MSPMGGLSDPSSFTANADLARRIPTTSNLLAAEDVSSFRSIHPLYEIHSHVAIQIARPPAIILLSGELHHSLLITVCVSGWEYGVSCSVLDAVAHIKSIAKVEDRPEQYNPRLSFSSSHRPRTQSK